MKWKELQYDDCSWELESDIASFHQEIEFFYRIQSQNSTAKQKSNLDGAIELKNRQKDFQRYDSRPDFRCGGTQLN